MTRLAVDPAALAGAGGLTAGVGDGLAGAVAALTAGFDANTGQDRAGLVFAESYEDTAGLLLLAAAAGVNACRRAGYLIGVSAANYSRAEAASKLGGGAAVLPAPPEPGRYFLPTMPSTTGPGVPHPVLWVVVEAFVGGVWPNGNPAALHAAAQCWRTFAAACAGVGDGLGGPKATVAAQEMPEGPWSRATCRRSAPISVPSAPDARNWPTRSMGSPTRCSRPRMPSEICCIAWARRKAGWVR